MGTNFFLMVEHDDDDENPAPPQGLMTMSDDVARTVYFALADYRDKLVKDIAKYHNIGEYYRECPHHGLPNGASFDPWCNVCVEVRNGREKGHQLEATRDEDLMFLTEELHKATIVLYHMNGGGSKEFEEWLSV